MWGSLGRNLPMFRFAIRDVLWLTVVVALLMGWWIDSRLSRQSQDVLREQLDAQRVENEALKSHAMAQRVQEAQLLIQLKEAELEIVRLQLVDSSSTAPER